MTFFVRLNVYWKFVLLLSLNPGPITGTSPIITPSVRMLLLFYAFYSAISVRIFWFGSGDPFESPTGLRIVFRVDKRSSPPPGLLHLLRPNDGPCPALWAWAASVRGNPPDAGGTPTRCRPASRDPTATLSNPTVSSSAVEHTAKRKRTTWVWISKFPAGEREKRLSRSAYSKVSR